MQLLRKPLGLALSVMADNRMKRAAELFHYPNASMKMSHIFSQEGYYFSMAERRKLMTIQDSGTLSFKESAHLNTLPRQLNAMEKQALFDLRYYLKDDLLVKVDRATMQFSLETRVPLLDYRIVEFALNLDSSLKIRQGQAKYLLKKILFQYVPASIFDRPKWGFSIPLERWMKGELQSLMTHYTSKEMCERFGLIDYKVLHEYISAFQSGRNYYYNRIWQIVVLHKCLEKANLEMRP
jgi:asparagine synthase (glutamine-hydrolysing)